MTHKESSLDFLDGFIASMTKTARKMLKAVFKKRTAIGSHVEEVTPQQR